MEEAKKFPDLKTEAVVGITTFLTMAYFVANPANLSTEGTGIPLSGALTATVLVNDNAADGCFREAAVCGGSGDGVECVFYLFDHPRTKGAVADGFGNRVLVGGFVFGGVGDAFAGDDRDGYTAESAVCGWGE